ncbi:MAG: transposase [Caldilineaceae bacterium]|nr:transposase [Caldilineaceae bacterium]
MTQEPDVQVVPKAKRRRFSAEYKRQILSEADRCSEPGQIGALLRREGLYSSHLTTWRRQREQGALGQKRSRKPDPQAAEIKRLEQENERLRTRLSRAEHVIDVQKKLAQLLGMSPEETPNSES